MPPTPKIRLTVVLGVLAGLAWAGSVTLSVVDAGAVDLPDPLVNLALGAAITVTINAVQVCLNFAAQRRVLAAIGVGVKKVTDDTGSIPKITETLGGVPTFEELVTLLGEMRAQVNIMGERQRWLLLDRGLLPPVEAVGPPPMDEDFERVKKDIAMKSFDTGRRIGRREADGA